MAKPELDALKRAYKAWHDSKAADTTAWLDLLADDVRLHSMASPHPALAFAAPRKSKMEVVNYLAAITKEWSMVHWTPEVFVCEGDTIAVFGTCAWTNKGTGRTAEVRTAHLWRFENGKAAELTELFDSAKVVAAASA